MARERGVLADLGLAEQIAVVGDDREIERAAQLDLRERAPVGPVGLDPDRLAAREAIGVARPGERALTPCVERERRVHVGIAEERPALRIVVCARLARFGARERGLARAGSCDRRGREQRAERRRYQPNTPNRFAVGARPNGVS